jgi:methyl-accepting chemotaxis protein
VTFVSRPIGELTRVTGEIVTRGDLSQVIRVMSGDEIGVLADRFREMVAKLRTIPLNLQRSVQDLAEAVAALTTVTRAQNDVVQRQASGLAEASSTTQEIKQTSNLAAAKAATVLDVALRAEKLSSMGNQAVEDSIAGMQEIRSQTEQIVARITDLAERTLRVGEIIESVKDIADQSNVLALNAGIEAAKAGDFGKGFGVVAREIRTLADQSLAATSGVREILGEIQNAIRSSVAITDRGMQKISSSMEQIRASGENLREMSEVVGESGKAARQIAASVSQQNAGITQVSSAISSLNDAMEQTMGGIRSTEDAVGRLMSISERVSEIVKSFRI